MKLLLLTDSNGRHLDENIIAEIPSMNVMSVIEGGQIPSIRGVYRERLQEIVAFEPDVVVLHMGHNDLVVHHYHNTQPLFITAVYHMLMELKDEVRFNFPNASIFISSLLPRGSSDYFSEDQTWRYNRIARRFGQMVVAGSNRDDSGYLPMKNRSLWGRITQLESYRIRFDSGGLHLNPFGRIAIVTGWADEFIAVGVQ
jgi:hypothetical protein